MKQVKIPLDQLTEPVLKVRRAFQAGEEDLEIHELAISIKQEGLVAPLLVRWVGNGLYEVLVGQRRLRACREIRLNPVPCLLKDEPDHENAANA